MVDKYGNFVYLTDDLPLKTSELTTLGVEGFTILINAKLDDDKRLAAYRHALKHIEDGDFDIDQPLSVQEIELKAHGIQESEPKKKKRRRSYKRFDADMKFLEQTGYDFFAAAESRWLDPERR